MEAPAVSRLFLAIPAAFVLALLLEHLRRNRGARVAVGFALCCGVYGILRGAWVQSISTSHGVPMPYRMAGATRIGAVSPIEIVGWMLAAALAWLVGATLVRRSAHRIACTGAIVLAALCLAVETAAITAGWWTWSIPPAPGAFLRVPPIALVDWAFVAFDFLLPFLLFRSGARLVDRLLGLALFPLHFASHLYLEPPVPAIPLSLFDLAHLGIPLWVFWRAVGERTVGEPARREWGRIVPGLAALLVAADTVVTVVLAGEARSAVFLLPLVVVGSLALFVGLREPARSAAGRRSLPIERALRAGAVLLVLAVLIFVRVPANRRREGYVQSVMAGVAKLNAGELEDARALLAQAISLRPDKAEPHLLIALALYRLDRKAEAARELEEAVRIKPALAQADEAQRLRRGLEGGR